jgi:hypothetical protein
VFGSAIGRSYNLDISCSGQIFAMGNGRISFPVSEWWWETAVPHSLFTVICSLLANGVGNGRSLFTVHCYLFIVSEWGWETAVPPSLFTVICSLLVIGGFETAFENGRLPGQGMVWMYNPHNLRIFYRYRGFI